MAELVKPDRGPRRWLVVMAKEPRCGAVKTRLARDIGAVAATQFYRRTLLNVSARLARDARWRTLIAVTPDSAIASPVWPHGAGLVAQGKGDLGARMQRVFDTLPPGPVVIIGADIPEIGASHIARAFRALGSSSSEAAGQIKGSHDAVLGPAQDGGYWLVGLRRTPRVPGMFANVRWSSAHTLADTLANLAGARVAMLEPLEDVDDGISHRRLGDTGSRIMLSYRSS